MKARTLILFVTIASLALALMGSSPVKEQQPEGTPLGQPGTSFRFVQRFGEPGTAYLADTTHLYAPYGVATNGVNVWIGEAWGSRALKFSDSGVFQQQIGTAGLRDASSISLSSISDLAVDSSGNIWIVDSFANHVAKFDSTGKFVSELGKAWVPGTANDRFSQPTGIAFDSAGNIYVSDGALMATAGGNQRIQIFNSTGSYLNTIGETGVSGTDHVHFNIPMRITIDSNNRLYVADGSNERVQIFNVSNPLAPVWEQTLGETGVAGANNSHFNFPEGVAVDAHYIYVADGFNNRVQVFNRAGRTYFTTLGTGVAGTGNNQFNHPMDVAVDSSNNIFVADAYNERVQQFNSSLNYVRTYGTTGVPYLTDGYHYSGPGGVAVNLDGSFYIIEENGQRLVKLNANGVPQWTIGEAGVTGSDNGHFSSPSGVAVDSAGRAYVADRINFRVQIYNSNGSYYNKLGNGFGSGDYQFNQPYGVAVDKNDDIYVADSGNQRIQIFDKNRNHIATLGTTGVAGSDNTHFSQPYGVAVDASGKVYVSDLNNHRVQKCTVSGASGTCTTFAGETGVPGNNFAHFSFPTGVAVDAMGRVYVADGWGWRVQVFDSSGAYLTTIGGMVGNPPAQLLQADGMALDATGNLYITDFLNHIVQKFAVGYPHWVQTNINGFGSSDWSTIWTLDEFNGSLYASVNNYCPDNQCLTQVWRSADGHSWSQIPIDSGLAAGQVMDGVVFQGKLYYAADQATSDPDVSYASVWRYDGTTWERVVADSFTDNNNYAADALAVYNGKIYAVTSNYTTGAEVWSSATGNSNSWTQVNADGFGNPPTKEQDSSVVVYKSMLYVGNGHTLWRYNGSTWTEVLSDEMAAEPHDTHVSAIAELGGKLYIALRNVTNGGQVWRSDDGSVFSKVVDAGLGNSANVRPYGLITFRDHLYLVFTNVSTGAEVYRTLDGTQWEKVAGGGWGNANNGWADYFNKSGIVFNGGLYFATQNNFGGQIWRYLPDSIYLPLVKK